LLRNHPWGARRHRGAFGDIQFRKCPALVENAPHNVRTTANIEYDDGGDEPESRRPRFGEGKSDPMVLSGKIPIDDANDDHNQNKHRSTNLEFCPIEWRNPPAPRDRKQ